MARTRTESGDVFSFVELAVAGGLSKSTYQFLEKSQLLQGGHGIEDFKRVATIGALVAGGVSLMGAAAMAKTIVKWEFNQEDGEAPSGIEELFITEFAHGKAGLSYRQFNEYWFHRKLYEFGIRPGQKALRSDAVIEIIERRFVFYRRGDEEVNRSEEPELRRERDKLLKQRRELRRQALVLWEAGQRPTEEMRAQDAKLTRAIKRTYPRYLTLSNSPLGESESASLVGWLEGWQRGLEPHLVLVTDKINFDDKASVEIYRRLNTEAHHARNNAVGTLTVNISLAIRRAFDRLAEHRGQRRATRASAPTVSGAEADAL
jgi:hypothetical protein